MTSVLVVDDSRFMRTVIDNILTSHSHEVLTADDGEAAVAAVERHDPDVVTMDVEMPGMDGIEATDRIMQTNPRPILMLSAHTEKGADATLKALSRGAVDFIAKPGGDTSVDSEDLEEQLVRKIRTVDRADLHSVVQDNGPDRPEAASSATTTSDGGAVAATAAGATPDVERTTKPESYVDDPTIVIGASTGGPKVIESIVGELPIELDARVLVVQHMPASFTDRLAARLDSILEYDVSEASDDQRVIGGEIVIAKGGYHMDVRHYANGRLRIGLDDDEPIHGVKPAIDVTMRTAARRISDPLVGIALTGMGKDGAEGIATISAAGGQTLAQDRASSPVFGIPQKAIETGCVDRVLPGNEIADGVCDLLAADDTDGDTDG